MLEEEVQKWSTILLKYRVKVERIARDALTNQMRTCGISWIVQSRIWTIIYNWTIRERSNRVKAKLRTKILERPMWENVNTLRGRL